MSDYGLKISKPGFDAAKCAKKDQIFNSENATFKIYGVFNMTVTTASSFTVGTSTIAHGLTYRPAFMFYWTSNLESDSILHCGNWEDSGGNIVEVTSNATNFICKAANGASGFTVSFRILAFVDEI